MRFLAEKGSILEQIVHLPPSYCLALSLGGIRTSPKVTPVFQSHRLGEILHAREGAVVRPLDAVCQPPMEAMAVDINLTGLESRNGHDR